MPTPDAFAAYHAHLIEASYDCVDRLAVNCYYQLGQTGGGFRTFWRKWKGDDSRLSSEGLRQAAGDFARRLKAHCQTHDILWNQAQYPTRRAAYDLAKLRGKGLVEPMPGQRRYQCRPEQLRVLCAYVVLREQVIKPVLAGVARKEQPPSPPKLSPLDQHYVALRAEFQRTCQTLGLAA